MVKLYVHDDGSVTCTTHAPHSLKGSLEDHPRKRLHWTPRGTWELMPASYYPEFKAATGYDLECETCHYEQLRSAS